MPDEARDRWNIAFELWVIVGVLDHPKKNLYNQNSACLTSFITVIMSPYGEWTPSLWPCIDVRSMWASFSYTMIQHVSWSIWLLSNKSFLQRTPQLSCQLYSTTYMHETTVTSQLKMANFRDEFTGSERFSAQRRHADNFQHFIQTCQWPLKSSKIPAWKFAYLSPQDHLRMDDRELFKCGCHLTCKMYRNLLAMNCRLLSVHSHGKWELCLSRQYLTYAFSCC